MRRWIPDRKWLASGVSGVLAFFLATAFDVPGETATAVVGGIMALVHYLVSPSVRDVLARVDDRIVDLARTDPRSPATDR